MKKFTLIELIIVCAFIGILVTLLLPPLSRAREKARLAVCLSNERQFGVGMLMLTKNNKDIMIRGSGGGDGPRGFTIYELAPYIGFEHKTTSYKTDDFYNLFKSVSIFRCPSSNLNSTNKANSLTYIVNSNRFNRKYKSWGVSIEELGTQYNARESYAHMVEPAKTGLFTDGRPGYINASKDFNSFNFWNWNDLPVTDTGIIQTFDTARMSHITDSFHQCKTAVNFGDGHGQIVSLRDNSVINEVFLTSRKYQ